MYHLVLEKEKYIPSIGSTSYPVIFSFTIPFITIEIVQKITSPLLKQDYIKLEEELLMFETNYWLIAVWTIYTVTTSMLLFRFLKHSELSKGKKNESVC
jgi:hypothetical protein